MTKHTLSRPMVDAFLEGLRKEERSSNTIAKYRRDLDKFLLFCGEPAAVDKEKVLSYKASLQAAYAVSSTNSMLAAINSFFRFAGWTDCLVKALRTQTSAFRLREKELTTKEYRAILRVAQGKGNWRLYLLMVTIVSTGIRISELPFITVEALRSGSAQVTLKGKSRVVLLPAELCRKLLNYAESRGITAGKIFITKSGKVVDRSNVCHDMKRLGEAAGVSEEKLFPHNLRHLFAVRYYETEHDLAHLADMLGHSNVNTTRIYTMVSEEEQMQQMNRMWMVIGAPVLIRMGTQIGFYAKSLKQDG